MKKMNNQTHQSFWQKLILMATGCILLPFFLSSPVDLYGQACETEITVTSTTDNGPGTLRQAILDICEGGRISFSSSIYGQTIELNGEELLINKDMQIDGPGADKLTISGGNIIRVFHIETGVEVRIEDLTIADGLASMYVPTSNSLDRGAGIWNKGELTLEDCVLKDHKVSYGVGGAGVFSEGENARLYVIRSEFTGNSHYEEPYPDPGSAIMNYMGKTYVWDSKIEDNSSGALVNKEGYMLLERTLVDGNSANWGGGLTNENGRMEIRYTTFSNNAATGNCHNCGGAGGAILNNSGQITIENSSIIDNGAGGSGRGGGSGAGIYNEGTMSITNSTLSGNETSSGISGGGGAVSNYGELSINFSTITNNVASNHYADGGGISGGTVHMSNTILAGNLVRPSEGNDPTNDANATIISGGYNIIGVSAGVTIDLQEGDQMGTLEDPLDPKLADLADNGGLTLTHALMEGSPAINAADPSSDLRKDQRGFERPREGRADIGAFESGFGTPPAEMIVTSFTLINSDIDADIRTLEDGDIVNLFELGNLLNIRANTTPDHVGSVVFRLNENNVRTENNAPYALNGDANGDYFDWTPAVGAYTLIATPYSESGGNGSAGEALSIAFEVIDEEIDGCTSPEVSELLLIAADPDTVLRSLNAVDTIWLYEGGSLAVEAAVDDCDMEIGSVVFEVNGNVVQVEHFAPYAIAGDNSGDFNPWNLTPGVYEVTATPYSSSNGQGTAGESLSTNILVIDAEERQGRLEGDWSSLKVYPNPTKGMISLEAATLGETTLHIHNLSGQEVMKKNVLLDTSLSLDISHLPKGVYLLSLTQAENRVIRKIIKQ